MQEYKAAPEHMLHQCLDKEVAANIWLLSTGVTIRADTLRLPDENQLLDPPLPLCCQDVIH